jgi:hypothetical protein
MHTLDELVARTRNPAVTPFSFSAKEARDFVQHATESLSVEELGTLVKHVDGMELVGNAKELRDHASSQLSQDQLEAHQAEMLQYARDLASASKIINGEYSRELDDLGKRELTDEHHFLMEAVTKAVCAGPYKSH